MNRFVRYIKTYLILGLPLVIACILLGTPKTNFLKMVQDALSWNLMFWFLMLILFLITLVVSANTREKALTRIANLKERDEREQFITGKASRITYIANLSMLILLFFFSIFSVGIYRLPEGKTINGKHHALNIGLNYNFFDSNKDSNSTLVYGTQTFALSKATIILMLIAWQLSVFNVTARREIGKAS